MIDITGVERAALVLASVIIVAALLSAGLILLLAPWLKAYALARPNARSSHREPTPQGGGAAVIVATLAPAWLGAALTAGAIDEAAGQFAAVTAGAVLLACVGAVDDMRGLPVVPRLVLQCAAVAIVIAALPADLRVVPLLPWWLERACLLLGGLWFINLTNFMDGIDWMTVAEAVPMTGALVVIGVYGELPLLPLLAAAALLGAMLGFAPFNRPVAKLFLGDVGSLPTGLVLAWLLWHLAARGHLAAALLLPLYYVADATLTLARRLSAGAAVWQAHRTHFYQRATDGGFAVSEVVTRVFLLNLALAALALLTVLRPGSVVGAVALGLGAALVAALLVSFARGTRT